MSIKENVKNFIKNPDKIVISTIFPVLFTFFFALYNIILGLLYNDFFGISISIYYVCLILARVIVVRIKNHIKNFKENIKSNIRKKTYICMSIFIFFIDLCLFVPITLMIISPKDFVFGIIPAIVVASYTTYKIIIAIINYVKVKKFNNLVYKFLKELSVIDALVSVLVLQHILIMVNGGMSGDMLVLSSITSFIFLTFIIIFSIVEMIKTLKLKKSKIL